MNRIITMILIVLTPPSLHAATVEPPNINHTIHFEAPIITKFQGEHKTDKGFRYIGTTEVGINISIYVVPPPKAMQDHKAVKDHYWALTFRNPSIDKKTVTTKAFADRTIVSYTTNHNFRGQDISITHQNVYFLCDGQAIDFHVSQTPMPDAMTSTPEKITSSVKLTPPSSYARINNGFVLARLTRHARRRSQRPFRPPQGVSYYAHFHKLGLVRLQ